jgi:hypothetical protein
MLESILKIKCLSQGLNEEQMEKVLDNVSLYYDCTRRWPDSNRVDDLIKEIKGEK